MMHSSDSCVRVSTRGCKLQGVAPFIPTVWSTLLLTQTARLLFWVVSSQKYFALVSTGDDYW